MPAADVIAAAGRGVVGAMAMTGMRTLAKGVGLLEEAPPEKVAREGVPALLARIPPEKRPEAIQLAHWAYGAAAGVVYGLLPRALRRRRFAGPSYGLAIWVAFEAGIGPLLRLPPIEWGTSERVVLAADHVLYGLVVGGRPSRP